MAAEAKQRGLFTKALDGHAQAAKMFRDAGASIRDKDTALSNSLLLLSQSHGKSALALKRFLRLHPEGVKQQDKAITHAIRGALGTKQEADMSDSLFLGRAKTTSTTTTTTPPPSTLATTTTTTPLSTKQEGASLPKTNNPVDDMYVKTRARGKRGLCGYVFVLAHCLCLSTGWSWSGNCVTWT